MKLSRAFWVRPHVPRRRDRYRGMWQAGWLLFLGLVAAGMTAFPDATITFVKPVRYVLSLAWGTGLRTASVVRYAGRSGMAVVKSLTYERMRTEDFRRTMEALKQESVAREEFQREALRLRELLKMKRDFNGEILAARVVGGDPVSFFGSLIIDSGADEGVREDSAVVATSGAVGRVLSVGPDHSVVLWLCDPRSRIAAYDQRSRVVGVLVGLGNGCELRYLAAGDDIQVGDRILTAGRGSLFPKGILIGMVKEVRKSGLQIAADIAPAVYIKRLEEVLILPRGASFR